MTNDPYTSIRNAADKAWAENSNSGVPNDYVPPGEPLPQFNGQSTLESLLAPITFKTAAQFCNEYVPLSYAIKPIVRSNSLYTLTARTGHGKTGFLVVTALAIATGRPDMLDVDVAEGRVLYIACENADDVRMRLMTAAYLYNISLPDLGGELTIVDVRRKPEDIEAAIKSRADQKFSLIIIDTFAALFDGDDVNNAVQGGDFIRRLRPLTKGAGAPSVIVAAHPVKNASEEQLIPYGSGAILNEVDGNLSLWKKPETGIVNLHWQGKLRGLEFQPVPFRFEITSSPDVVDDQGCQVLIPVMVRGTAEGVEEREKSDIEFSTSLLRMIIDEPNLTVAELCEKTGKKKSMVYRKLKELTDQKLVEVLIHRYRATPKGERFFE